MLQLLRLCIRSEVSQNQRAESIQGRKELKEKRQFYSMVSFEGRYFMSAAASAEIAQREQSIRTQARIIKYFMNFFLFS